MKGERVFPYHLCSIRKQVNASHYPVLKDRDFTASPVNLAVSGMTTIMMFKTFGDIMEVEQRDDITKKTRYKKHGLDLHQKKQQKLTINNSK